MAETKILYTEQQIQKRVHELASQLANDYQEKKPILIGILKGSFIFFADLLRELYRQHLSDIEVDFMTISSYGKATSYSGSSQIIHDLTNEIKDRHVLIVEDIIDTGHTLLFTKNYLEKKNPASLKIITFLDKKERREVALNADYVGFTLTGKPWIEGYGLDGGEYGRGRPDIVAKNISESY